MICPFCKEEILDDAVKCKHCKSMLTDSLNKNMSAATAIANKNKTYRFIALCMIIFGFFIMGFSGMGPYQLKILPPPLPAIIFWSGLIWLIVMSIRKKKS